jgi:hypothetical protein
MAVPRRQKFTYKPWHAGDCSDTMQFGTGGNISFGYFFRALLLKLSW